MPGLLWKYQVDFAPVFLRGGAAARPAGRVIELVGHLRRPVAADVAVEEIAFDRLAQSRRAARAIHFPSGREHRSSSQAECAARLLRRLTALQCDDILLRGFRNCLIDLRCLAVDSLQSTSSMVSLGRPLWGFVVVELRQKRRVSLGELRVNLQADVGPSADPLAVVQVRLRRVAVARVRLVITAARADRPRPAVAAVGLLVDVVFLEKRALRRSIDAVGARCRACARPTPRSDGTAPRRRRWPPPSGRDRRHTDTPCSSLCESRRAFPSRSRTRGGGSARPPRGIPPPARGTDRAACRTLRR